MIGVENDNDAVIGLLNGLAQKRFELEIRLQEMTTQFETEEAQLAARHEQELAAINHMIAQLDLEISGQILSHRSDLIAQGKQSFATLIAKFQFRKGSGKMKIVDRKAVMALARELGVIRKVASAKYEWRLNLDKFSTWLAKNGELRSQFEPFLDYADDESLTMQPNGTYVVHHGKKRISPPSISIGLP